MSAPGLLLFDFIRTDSPWYDGRVTVNGCVYPNLLACKYVIVGEGGLDLVGIFTMPQD